MRFPPFFLMICVPIVIYSSVFTSVCQECFRVCFSKNIVVKFSGFSGMLIVWL